MPGGAGTIAIVYDNGIVRWGQSYDGAEEIYYTFSDNGKVHELIRFVREENPDSDLYCDYYYIKGNEESGINLQSDEEYESLVSSEPIYLLKEDL